MLKINFFNKPLLIILFLSSAIYINPEIFKFKHILGSKQRIEAIMKGQQLQDNVLVITYIQQYKTIRTIKDFKNDIAIIEDTYYFYNQNNILAGNLVQEISNVNTTKYSRDSTGRINLFNDSVFLTYRDVPVFPETDIDPGYKWTAKGIEVQDLFNDKVISRFPIDVNYVFLGYEEVDGKRLAKFSYEHTIDITNNNNPNIDYRIKRILGVSKTIMYFDNEVGTRVKEEYSRDYQFLLQFNNQSTVFEFIDDGERIWYPIELMDKDKIVKDLKKQLKDEKVKDIDVVKNDQGVKLSIENIHFYPDSPELLPGEYDRLTKIAKILKKYNDRGVMIIGHTTDKGTEEGRQRLSIQRAKVVMDYLIGLDAINVSKSSYGGKGGTEPIADNSTEEGMKKNRRVEINILEE